MPLNNWSAAGVDSSHAISGGNIAYYKPNGKLILFRKADLDKWLEANRIPSNAELLDI
jgi:hypothetical protein